MGKMRIPYTIIWTSLLALYLLATKYFSYNNRLVSNTNYLLVLFDLKCVRQNKEMVTTLLNWSGNGQWLTVIFIPELVTIYSCSAYLFIKQWVVVIMVFFILSFSWHLFIQCIAVVLINIVLSIAHLTLYKK